MSSDERRIAMSKRVVAVGINDYTGFDPTGKSNLGSCVADAESMFDLFVSAFGFDGSESVIIKDGNATSGRILAALRDMLAKSIPGDVACFYYSGHGSRTSADPLKSDCDLYYESIIPAAGRPITDRDLLQLATTLEPSTVNFTVVLDSCHSGGMDQETDSPFKCKSPRLEPDLLERLVNYLKTLIPCGLLLPASSGACDNNVSDVSDSEGRVSLSEDPDKVFIEQAKATLIAGCKFDELSWEFGGHGLLTKAFLDIVNSSDFQISYSDLLDQLRTSVRDQFASSILPGIGASDPQNQTPQLRGQANRMQDPFLAEFVTSQ
jgi:hypothetical protein